MEPNKTAGTGPVQDIIPPISGAIPTPSSPSPVPPAQPQPAPSPTAPITNSIPVKVEEVPVASPGGQTPQAAAAPAPPAAESTWPAGTVDHETDKELDKIMNEVHSDSQKPVDKTDHKTSKPIMIAVIALLVAILLGVVAFFAFRGTQKTSSSNPSTAQGATSSSTVSTTDIDTASKNVDQQLNGLNDTSDFAATDVSDAALGL